MPVGNSNEACTAGEGDQTAKDGLPLAAAVAGTDSSGGKLQERMVGWRMLPPENEVTEDCGDGIFDNENIGGLLEVTGEKGRYDILRSRMACGSVKGVRKKNARHTAKFC